MSICYLPALVTKKLPPVGIKPFLCAAFVLSTCPSIPTQAASFDCNKARLSVENRVCSNPTLSVLDEKLETSYKDALNKFRFSSKEQVVSAQKRWLKLTRNKCVDDACLMSAYQARIKEFREVYPFFGVYQCFARACENEIVVLSPDSIVLGDFRKSSYLLIESDTSYLKVNVLNPNMILTIHGKPSDSSPNLDGPQDYKNEIEVEGSVFFLVDSSLADDQGEIFLKSGSEAQRNDALTKLNEQRPPNLQYYNELGLNDSSAEVRRTAAYNFRADVVRLTPILLRIMTTDSSIDVRRSAAFNLHCQFICNGVDVTAKHIHALVGDMPLLEKAITDEIVGKSVIEILGEMWCRIPEDSRQRVLSKLTPLALHKIDFARDTRMLDTQQAAKALLKNHSETCSD